MLSLESKLHLFRDTNYFKKEPEFTDVSVSNDLTKTERENDKKLWEEAKNMTAKDTSGKYQYKVRGPVKKNSKAENLKKNQYRCK